MISQIIFDIIKGSQCLSEVMTSCMTGSEIRSYVGLIHRDNLIDLILDSEPNEGFSISNLNTDVVTIEAQRKLFLFKWVKDLGLDLLGYIDSLSLTEYIENINLTCLRLCVCGKCPNYNGRTIRDCGPIVEIAEDLTPTEKMAHLIGINQRVNEQVRCANNIVTHFVDPKKALICALYDQTYKSIVRSQICGCGGCEGIDLYLDVSSPITHITRNVTGLYLFKCTLDGCMQPYLTDIQWAGVFSNVIVEPTTAVLAKYKSVLPRYFEQVSVMLNELGFEEEELQGLLTRNNFEHLNRKYGVRKVMTLCLTYNSWAKEKGLPKIKTRLYNDRRAKCKADYVLSVINSIVSVERDSGKCYDWEEIVRNVKMENAQIMSDNHPYIDENILVENDSYISELQGELMREIEDTNCFRCLEKDKGKEFGVYLKSEMKKLAEDSVPNYMKLRKSGNSEMLSKVTHELEGFRLYKNHPNPPLDYSFNGGFVYDQREFFKALNLPFIKDLAVHDVICISSGKYASNARKILSGKTPSKAYARDKRCLIETKESPRPLMRYPLSLIEEHEAKLMDSRRRNRLREEALTFRRSKFLLEVTGLKNCNDKGLVFEVRDHPLNYSETGVAAVSAEQILKNYVMVRFARFVRFRIAERLNDRLEQHTRFRLDKDYKFVSVRNYTPGDQRSECRVLYKFRDAMEEEPDRIYETLKTEFKKEVESEALDMRGVFNSVVKHFNKVISRGIRNRRSVSRIIFMNDEEKFKIAIATIYRDFDTIKSVRQSNKHLRSTEIRRILGGFG